MSFFPSMEQSAVKGDFIACYQENRRKERPIVVSTMVSDGQAPRGIRTFILPTSDLVKIQAAGTAVLLRKSSSTQCPAPGS